MYVWPNACQIRSRPHLSASCRRRQINCRVPRWEAGAADDSTLEPSDDKGLTAMGRFSCGSHWRTPGRVDAAEGPMCVLITDGCPVCAVDPAAPATLLGALQCLDQQDSPSYRGWPTQSVDTSKESGRWARPQLLRFGVSEPRFLVRALGSASNRRRC